MNLSDTELLATIERIKAKARIMGFGFEADDIAQDMILTWLETPYRGQSLKHGIIDYMRRYYGRSGSRKHALKFRSMATDYDFPLPESPEDEIHSMLDLHEYVRGLSERNREMFSAYIMGFTNVEIAQYHSISAGRTGFLLNKLVLDLHKKVTGGLYENENADGSHGQGAGHFGLIH